MSIRCFGCSITQGPLFLPLEQTWPNILSEKLKKPFLNYGRPGASNEIIVHQFFKHQKDYQPNDIFVFLMTYNFRYFSAGPHYVFSHLNEHLKKSYDLNDDQLTSILPSDHDSESFYRLIGDVDKWQMIKTFQTLHLLEKITPPQTYLFSLDTGPIIEACKFYGYDISKFSKFHLWPRISLKNHITFSGVKGHPTFQEQTIIANLMADVIQVG